MKTEAFKPSIKFTNSQSVRNIETMDKVPAFFGKNPYNMRLDKTTNKRSGTTKNTQHAKSNIACL